MTQAAKEFRALMISRGWTIRQAATEVEIDPSRLHRLLKGVGTPSLYEAVRFQEVAKIEPRKWLQ